MKLLNIDTILAAIPGLAPLIAAVPEARKLWGEMLVTFAEDDQAVLKAALAVQQAKSNADHAALQTAAGRATGDR